MGLIRKILGKPKTASFGGQKFEIVAEEKKPKKIRKPILNKERKQALKKIGSTTKSFAITAGKGLVKSSSIGLNYLRDIQKRNSKSSVSSAFPNSPFAIKKTKENKKKRKQKRPTIVIKF